MLDLCVLMEGRLEQGRAAPTNMDICCAHQERSVCLQPIKKQRLQELRQQVGLGLARFRNSPFEC
jgi:hypothetical protein